MPDDILTQTGFHPVIKQWFNAQFDTPSPPQTHGWPSIAKGKHTLILAPTGSGKTLAAFLWSIDHLFRKSLHADEEGFSKNRGGIHTLYISPLKALNNDIQHNLKAPLRPRKRIEISQIDGQIGTSSKYFDSLLKLGYEVDGESLVFGLLLYRFQDDQNRGF